MRVGLWLTVVYGIALALSDYVTGHSIQFENIGLGNDYLVLIADAFGSLAGYIGFIAMAINVALPSMQKANARKAAAAAEDAAPELWTPTEARSL